MTTHWSKPKREELLRKLGSTQSSKTYPLEFQEKIQYLPVHTVDVDMPCYRLKNGRTRAAQSEWVVTYNKPNDFFEDPDSEPALIAQHAILHNMVKNTELLKILKTSKQNQPLVLDHNGYLVNGNRRLCAMRSLLEENPEKNIHFGHIDTVILPPCSEESIKELEGRLQVAADGREDYDWVTFAIMLRDLRLDQWDDERIAKLYKNGRNEVRDYIQMLDDAEAYLADRNHGGLYSKVSDKEYAFKEMLKVRRKCNTDEPKKDLITHIAYSMMDSPTQLGDRLYKLIPHAYEHLDRVAEAIREEFPEDTAIDIEYPNMDLLGGQLLSSYSDVVPVVSDPLNQQNVATVVCDTLEEIKAEQKQQKSARFCFKQVKQAHTLLNTAISAWNETTDSTGIPASLDTIETAIQELRKMVTKK